MKVRLLVLCSVLVFAFVALTAAQSVEITKAKTTTCSLPVPIEEVHDHKGCNHDHDHDHDHHEHSDTALKPEEHAHDEHEHDEHEHDEHAHDENEHEHDEHEHEEHEHAEQEHAHEEHEHEHEHKHEDGKHDEHEHDGHKHDEHEHEHKVQAPAKPVAHNHDQHDHGKGEAAHKENNAHRGHDHHGHAGGKCPFSHSARKHEQHAHDHHEPKEAKSVKLRTSFDKPQSWLYAIGATLFISAAPVAILPFVPLDRSEARRPLLKVLLSFAVGGLLGDVFLHLLPHSMTPHNHEGHAGHSEGGHDDHGHGSEGGEGEDLTVGLFVLAGILVFFLVEKFVRASGHSHSHGGHSHGHSHGGHSQSPQGAKKNGKKNEALEKKKEDSKEKEKEGSGNKKNKKNKNKKKQASNVEVEAEEIKTGGWLNLVADATHNFTDGLALASSFQASTAIGLTTTVAVLLHEIPHEIGDFAILVQSGFPRKKAMYLQFATGFGALAGCLIGLVAEGFGSFIEWVLPFTAGGFIYIATVGVIPDLLEDTKLKQSVKEALAACTGVALMVLVARLEHMEFFAGIV